MGKVTATTIVSHWNQMIPGMEQSSKEFYQIVEGGLESLNLKNIRTERIHLSEGGIFSAKREYLQIRRDNQVFHVCAAPFGPSFFISWWLGSVETGLWALIGKLPMVGPLIQRFLKPVTYFKIDTALMFQSLTHGAVMEALDSLTAAKGIRQLSGDERKPIMRDFFAQIGG
jgi:hypothetical protein